MEIFKVLWITNITFPEPIRILTGKDVINESGGWMLGAASIIAESNEIQLSIASPSPLVNKVECIRGEKIVYYLFPYGKGNLKYNSKYEQHFRIIHDECQPDIVHIHGTEFSHGLSYVTACGNKNVVVSIQGLVSVISRFYDGGLTLGDILKNMTLRDVFKGNTYLAKHRLKKRGELEVELLKKVNHVIGRTHWDKSHIWSINSSAKYYHCDETLRPEFYTGQWKYETCIPYTIFISSASYPVKGFHQLLKVAPLLIKEYPQLIIRVAGTYPPKKTLIQKLKSTGYSMSLERLIKKNNLQNNIVFLGTLNAEQMKSEFLAANVFICPSSIENSPNTLCEAQLLGVPCISSYVGGTMDLIPSADCGFLYRYEELEMLAYYIDYIFKNSRGFDNSVMRTVAKKRHNRALNAQNTISIYKEILTHKHQ